MEIELTKMMDPEEFKRRLEAQLPADELPILSIESAPVKRPNGRIAESATKLLDKVAWSLAIEILPRSTTTDTTEQQQALEVS